MLNMTEGNLLELEQIDGKIPYNDPSDPQIEDHAI